MRKLLVTVVLLAVPLAAACSSSPAPVTIRGTLTPSSAASSVFGSGVNGTAYASCTAAKPGPGTQVTVTDPSGKVIGTGTLGQWNRDTGKASGVTAYRCDMPFTVSGVPAEPRYGLQVAGVTGTSWVTSASSPVSLTAG